nr:DUF2946 domain-containing protein [Pseudomonas californiensis]
MSLFAMLMIFIGPLVSQSMPMDQHASMPMPGSMSHPMPGSMPGSMDMPAESHAHHADNAATKPADAGMSDHALWAKCGYCTLLFSCPALSRVLVLVAATPPRPADFFAAALQQGHAQRSVFPNARSRAPPTLQTV